MPRAEIATHQAKFTLDQLHAELSGKVQANKAGVRDYRNQLHTSRLS